MSRTQLTLLPATMVILALLPARMVHAAPVEPPTMSQIQSSFDAKQYAEVLKQVAQTLPIATRYPDKGYDKSKLMAFKAESHLQLKQYSMASSAYESAAKDSTDPTVAALYKATATLIRRSNAGQYQPRQPTTRPADAAKVAEGKPFKPEPIDIIEPTSRQEAFKALFADESHLLAAKIESMKKLTRLPPLMEGIKQLSDLRGIEIAATGSDDASKQLVSGLSDHANQLMSEALKTMTDNVEKLAAQANKAETVTQTTPGGGLYNVTTKRGLNSNEKSALLDTAATCKNIAAACEQFTKASGADSSSNTGFSATQTQAQALEKHIQEVVNTDYNPTVDNPPPINPTSPRAPRITPQVPREGSQ